MQISVVFGYLLKAYVLEKRVMVDAQKIETINNWVWSSSMIEARSFMGLGSYYQRFVKNFTSIATHFTILT